MQVESGWRAAGRQATVERTARRPVEFVDMVTVPERQGLETVDILRLRGGCGAVLHDTPGSLRREAGGWAGPGAESTLSFLVPFGTAEDWRLPGSTCRHVPVPGPEHDWLLPPGEGSGCAAFTDPGQLREALGEAARTLAACDGC